MEDVIADWAKARSAIAVRYGGPPRGAVAAWFKISVRPP
jgi:hypothetical protein